jgi:hypothetical protein
MLRPITSFGLLLGVPLGCMACSSGRVGPRADSIRVEDVKLERAVAGESSIWFIDATLVNDTDMTVNNVHDATLSAGATEADFDLTHNREPFDLVGCHSPDPWDIPPGGSSVVRMRISFLNDPADFTVACSFDPELPGIEYLKSQVFEAPRQGPSLPQDFAGEIDFALYATMDECSWDECQAVTRGSVSVEGL